MKVGAHPEAAAMVDGVLIKTLAVSFTAPRSTPAHTGLRMSSVAESCRAGLFAPFDAARAKKRHRLKSQQLVECSKVTQ
jgi:hypothetical protein